MNDANDIPLHGDYVVQSGSTAFEGLFKLSQRRKHDHKDLIFFVFGENDRKYMNVDDFTMTYEALMRKAKRLHPNAELFTITESSLKYEEFASAIGLYPNIMVLQMWICDQYSKIQDIRKNS